MRIAITGSSGLVGTALSRRLGGDGHTVVPVTRRDGPPGSIRWDPQAGRLDPSDLSGLDAVVHLAGEGIGEKRWTADQKRRIVESRTRGTALLSEAIAAAAVRPGVLVSGSAVGYYGSRGDEVLTEQSAPGDDFLAHLCLDWEAATGVAEAAGVRVAHIRTGIVLDRDGGVLSKMSLPIRFGVGGRLGSGRQWMSWIALADEVEAIVHLLTHDLSGSFNLTAPEPVTNAQLTKALGAQLHRPTFLPVPAFAPRLLLGRELADNLLFASQRVLPERLQEAGYEFRHPGLAGALRSILGQTR